MKEMPSESIVTKQILHTNSVIRLQVPLQVQNHPHAIQWLSQPNPRFNNNYILTRFDINKTSRTSQFQCTPLDYGSTIVGKVLVPQENLPVVFIEEKFGPIAVEKQIIQQFDCQQVMDVKIILNKTITLKGGIEIIGNQNVRMNSQKAIISLKAPNFKFDIRIDQNIRLPSNNSFFKFYDKEEDCLGISIYHQHSELVEIMKDEKNVQLFGFYIKISFKNRILRDIFLFRLIMKLGIPIQQLHSGLQENYTENIKPNNPNPEIGKLGVPASELKSKRKQSKIKQLDDQILKLLNDQSEADNECSLDMADAELLLSSTNNIDLARKTSIKLSDMQKYEIKTQFLKQKNQNTPSQKSRQQININTYGEDLNNKSKSNQSKLNNNLLTPEGNQNYLRSTIFKLTNQVKMLRKQNRRLVHQNKKLKDENMRLRFKQIKNTSISRIHPSKNYDNNEKLNLTKQRSSSIAPFNHQKRQSIYPFNTENRHLTTKSNFTQDNFHQVIVKERPKLIREILPLASSSGSILIASSQIKNTDRTDQGLQLPYQTFNSSSVKDLSKQSQIPEEKLASQKLTYHRSQELMRRMFPQQSKKSQGSLYDKQCYVKSSLNAVRAPNFCNSSVQFVNSTIFGR